MDDAACSHATFISSVVVSDDQIIRNLVQCNGNTATNCGFTFVFKDEDGEEPNWRDGWAILSTEMAEWDATHQAWSRMTVDQRAEYEASAGLESP